MKLYGTNVYFKIPAENRENAENRLRYILDLLEWGGNRNVQGDIDAVPVDEDPPGLYVVPPPEPATLGLTLVDEYAPAVVDDDAIASRKAPA